MLLPEGNRGRIVCCRLKRHSPHPARRQPPLDLAQQHRPDAAAPVRVEHIYGDDVSPRAPMRRDDEPRRPSVRFC